MTKLPELKRKVSVEGRVILPSLTPPKPWEVWSFRQGQSKLEAACDLPFPKKWRRQSILALPTADVFCLALWLNETVPQKLGTMIRLQLETRGIKVDQSLEGLSWEIVESQPNRTLVMVGVLPATLPENMQLSDFELWEASPRFRNYEEDALTLWREQGRLCLGWTRGRKLVHFQSLAENTLTPSVVADLVCIREALTHQQIIHPLKQVILWFPANPEEKEVVQQVLEVEVRSIEVPKPVFPEQSWSLRSAFLPQDPMVSSGFRDSIKPLILTVSLLYLIILGFFAARLAHSWFQVSQENKWLASHQSDLAQLSPIRSEWDWLTPLVQSGNYPLEILLHCSQALPEGAHLLWFSQNGQGIKLRAEAEDSAQVSAFVNRLKGDSVLANYQWSVTATRTLTGGLAHFEVQGVYATIH